MGRLSSEEWHTLARREAAREYGKDHKGVYTALQFAPHIAGFVLLAALGGGAWWLYSHAHAALSHVSGAQVPHSGDGLTWVGVAGAILAIVTVGTYRPG